jgi:hypothetical protein
MQIRQTELDIPLEDPFQNDALNRKDLEPPLTQFINQSSGSFVLALDGSWGSGKTTFLKMWQVKLAQKGHACLYLNAWETDFTQEPLVAVIGELSNAIEEFAKEKGEKGNNLRKQMKKARKIAGDIAKRAIPVAAKLATMGIIDTDVITEKIAADFASEIVEDRIKDYENGKSEIEEFKKALISLADEVENLNPEKSSKVVVIIDELDRCRPTYAVQLLERIKHLFSVPGIVFILGIDRSQLNHSIRAIYGSDFDAQGYLRRFIDLDYRLPEPQAGDYCLYLFKRFGVDKLIKKHDGLNQNKTFYLELVLGGLMYFAGMSLRQQEQIVARLRIVLQTIKYDLFEKHLGFLLFLREWNRDVYTSFLTGQIEIDDFLNEIDRLPHIKETYKISSEEFDRNWIEGVFLANSIELNRQSPHLDRYKKIIESQESTDEPTVKKAQSIICVVNNLIDSRNSTIIFKLTEKQLELTYNFISYNE